MMNINYKTSPFNIFGIVLASSFLLHAVKSLATPSVISPTLAGRAVVDYSGASEFIEEHYKTSKYFGDDETKRVEPIFNAREGVLLQDGSTVSAMGAMNGCGFCLMDSPTQVQDFENLDGVRSNYLLEMKNTVGEALELNKDDIESIIFWHPMIRGQDVVPRHRTESEPAIATAAQMVHIDTDVGAYGLDGILDLVEKNLVDPEATNKHQAFDKDRIRQLIASDQRRFIFVNTWRPLAPVHSRPLALWATRYEEVEGMFPKMRPSLVKSRWYVFPEMKPTECLVFKQYDRRLDLSCDLWHTSLDIQSDAFSTPGAPRRSFDMKAMVILKEKVPAGLDRLAASVQPDLTLEESEEFCGDEAKRRGKVNL